MLPSSDGTITLGLPWTRKPKRPRFLSSEDKNEDKKNATEKILEADFWWLEGYEDQLFHPHRNAVDIRERTIKLYQLLRRARKLRLQKIKNTWSCAAERFH
ncbi:hypothetical protein FGIG_08381 [Fasciola gigantica]|uniref:Uncharacterized protein n=1 Tax=Fasciola gigantica TaxID=46835 RepID=A0A504YIN6_FASGI|nr:hypothetical protein FGIG_08381 [Fasciola gigantica]